MFQCRRIRRDDAHRALVDQAAAAVNWIIRAFAVAWGLAVLVFVAAVLTVETSIPIAALAAAPNSPVAAYLAVFMVLAFLVWLLPVLMLRAVLRRCRRRGVPRNDPAGG